MARAIHIRDSSARCAAIATELERLGQPCTCGDEVPTDAEYVLSPTGRIGRLGPGSVANRILRDLQSLRAHAARVWADRDFTFTDFWHDVPESIRHGRDAVRQAEIQTPDYARRTLALSRFPSRTSTWAPKPANASSGEAATSLPRPVILHIMPWDLTVGGGQRMLDDWCTFEGKAWAVHIVTAGKSPGLWAFRGATIHVMNTASELEDLCRSLQPSVVVTHNIDYALCAGARFFPQVWYAHGERILEAPRPTWAVPRSCVCNFPQEMHSTWRSIPRRVVRLGVNTERFRPYPPEKRDYLVAGIVGRLSKEKVPQDFVEAMKTWVPGPWRIRFIGDGILNHHQGWVREQTAGLPWVEFTGDIAPDAMPAAYQDLDAVLIPSSTETGSYALAEALAAGLPVVCRRLPGPCYCGGGSPVYAETDVGLLRALRYLDDADARAARGSRSRRWAETNLDVHRQMTGLTRAYAAAAEPRCSVLMPVFNTPPNFLREAVESVQAQMELLWELVIVDDGSDDSQTLMELGILATAEPRIRVVRLGHVGISTALNYGLNACRCDLVARMDSDDVMFPGRLAKQMEYMRANGHVDVLGTQMAWSTHGSTTQHAPVIDLSTLATRDFLLNHPTVMFRRHVIVEAGGYATDLQTAEDFDLWIRLLKARRVIHNLPDVLLKYRVHPGQITWKNNVTAMGSILRARNGVPQLAAGGLGNVFDTIYTKGLWGAPMSSGRGSTPEATAELKRLLPILLGQYRVTRMLDAGCGVSTWMRDAVPPQVTKYTGMDVSPLIIDANRCLEERDGWEFIVGDLSNGKVPEAADLILCRDVLTHLPAANVLTALHNAAAAAPLLLATHWPGKPNVDIPAGQWRPIDLEAEPYCLPPPLKLIQEADQGKYLALFDLSKWGALVTESTDAGVG